MKHNTISEMRNIIDALEKGRKVQFQQIGTKDEWREYNGNTPNFFSFRYRIKPDEPKKEWYPFNSVDEFLQAAGGLTAIWLKRKADNQMILVTSIDNSDSSDPIRLTSSWVSLSDIFEHFTFADGTPCGVEEYM